MVTSSLIKFDSEKVRVELIETEFIWGVGRVLTVGAEKYAAHNWKKAKKNELSRYEGAMMRHLLAYMGGEKLDPETGLPHLHHLSCNAMFLCHFDDKAKS